MSRTCRGMEQVWGGTDPVLWQLRVGQEVVHVAGPDIVTAWGEVLPHPAYAAQDLEALRAICATPNLWYPVPPIPPRILELITLHPLFGCWELPMYDDPKPRARYPTVSAKSHQHINRAPGEKIRDKEEAHRFMWRCLVGPIPEGYFVDHRCLNKACCWPRHLEPVTPEENTRRGRDDRRHAGQRYLGQLEPTVPWVPPTTGRQSSG